MKEISTLSNLSIITIGIIVTITSSNINWSKSHWKGIIEADGKGYYAYLPAVFIYQDLNFGFFDEIEKEKYYSENRYYDYRSSANGKVINKYYCGTALAQAPFFLIAHFLSYLSGYETDGYSKLYPIFINIAAIFYLFLGLLYLNFSLGTYQIKEWHRVLVLFAAVFGTNLFYYVVGEPAMSHVYSFAFISMFFYYSLVYFNSFQNKYFFILAILLGIIVLIRPVNGLVVFVLPFAAGNIQSLKEGIKTVFQRKSMLLVALLVFLAIPFIQLIIYKVSAGSFFVYSYQEEGFNFLSPHIFDMLFSYKKGLFLYTPMYLLAFAGCYYLWKSSRFRFYSWLGFFLLITYVLSSWWMWYYGGSFSSRVFVEYIPMFMMLLAIPLGEAKSILLKRTYASVIILLIIICQVQTYQYRYYEIHWADMTKEKYWDVFLRVDRLIK